MSPRAYTATKRRAAAAATRDRICQAAEDLFVSRGYDRTSIKAVAGEAGVAEATVYLAFPNKPALLDAAILRAVGEVGESMQRVMTAPPDTILQRLAESNALTMQRAARIIAIGETAVRDNADMRAVRERAHDRLRAAFGAVGARLEAAGLLRDGLTAEAAGGAMYAVNNETTYLRATERGGVRPEDYAAWLTNLLEGALLR